MSKQDEKKVGRQFDPNAKMLPEKDEQRDLFEKGVRIAEGMVQEEKSAFDSWTKVFRSTPSAKNFEQLNQRMLSLQASYQTLQDAKQSLRDYLAGTLPSQQDKAKK